MAVSLTALVGLLLLAELAGAGAGDRDTLVRVGPDSSGFGEFTGASDPDEDVSEMRRIFGKPDSADRKDRFLCTLRWREPGITAQFAVFGTDSRNPCRKGTFLEARLTDRSWHTKSGIRPGSPARAARRESLRRCTKDTCGVKGFALELHHIDCAAERTPGVIAQAAEGRVTALIVRRRGCE